MQVVSFRKSNCTEKGKQGNSFPLLKTNIGTSLLCAPVLTLTKDTQNFAREYNEGKPCIQLTDDRFITILDRVNLCL